LAISLVPAVAFAQASAPVGLWENPHTGMVIEFSSSGEVTMGGGAPAHYSMCGENGANICIVGQGFECHYRAKFDAKTMRLDLFTGRPTKECPEGHFGAKSH
jgi:hypothetical protein